MTLVGVGIDVASLARIEGLVQRYGGTFTRRWFDADDFPQGRISAMNLAKSFAAKEAVWKALPHDSTAPLPWRAIVTRPGAASHVFDVELRGLLGQEAASYGVRTITTTVTVRGDLVVAVALVEGETTRNARSARQP